MKKSWHPLLLKNQERVWLEEKKALEEKKKLDQLRKEKEEERQLQELQRLQEEQTGKKRTEKLEWMYTTPATGSSQNPNDLEDYLLGKKRVDKILTADENAKVGASHKNFIAVQNANTARDVAAKVREDPLFAIKQQEQAAYEALMSNPLRLREMQERNGMKPKKEKKRDKEEKKKRKHKHREDDRDRHSRSRSPVNDQYSRRRSRSPYRDDSRRRRSPIDDRYSRRRSPSPYRDNDRRRRSPSPISRRRSPSPYSRRDSHRNDRREQLDDRRRYSPGPSRAPHKDGKDSADSMEDEGYGSRSRSGSDKRSHSRSPELNHRKRSRSPGPGPSRDSYRPYNSHDNAKRPRRNSPPPPPRPSTSNNQAAEDRAARLAAMTSDAKTMSVERQERLKQLLEKEKAELVADEEARAKSKGMGGFLNNEQKRVFSATGGLEERIRRGRGGMVIDAD